MQTTTLAMHFATNSPRFDHDKQPKILTNPCNNLPFPSIFFNLNFDLPKTPNLSIAAADMEGS
jgi:hypothetical protein